MLLAAIGFSGFLHNLSREKAPTVAVQLQRPKRILAPCPGLA
jgi:hypothetical protein